MPNLPKTHDNPNVARDTLDDLGLSSLERVELMVALENRFQTRVDELKQLVEQGSLPEHAEPPVDFPTWTRAWPARVVRRLSLATWILPLARLFAHTRVEGLDISRPSTGP